MLLKFDITLFTGGNETLPLFATFSFDLGKIQYKRCLKKIVAELRHENRRSESDTLPTAGRK
jgi:hypothetical protein